MSAFIPASLRRLLFIAGLVPSAAALAQTGPDLENLAT